MTLSKTEARNTQESISSAIVSILRVVTVSIFKVEYALPPTRQRTTASLQSEGGLGLGGAQQECTTIILFT